MARGEGAEQYAATLLTVKPISTDIKTVKVSARFSTHFLSLSPVFPLVRKRAPKFKVCYLLSAPETSSLVSFPVL